MQTSGETSSFPWCRTSRYNGLPRMSWRKQLELQEFSQVPVQASGRYKRKQSTKNMDRLLLCSTTKQLNDQRLVLLHFRPAKICFPRLCSLKQPGLRHGLIAFVVSLEKQPNNMPLSAFEGHRVSFHYNKQPNSRPFVSRQDVSIQLSSCFISKAHNINIPFVSRHFKTSRTKGWTSMTRAQTQIVPVRAYISPRRQKGMTEAKADSCIRLNMSAQFACNNQP